MTNFDYSLWPLGVVPTEACNPRVQHGPNTFCSACFVHDDTLPSDEGFDEYYYGQYDAPDMPHWNDRDSRPTRRALRSAMGLRGR